jgi:predicted nucleic acid-binding protein
LKQAIERLMRLLERMVVDTNVLISLHLLPSSVPGQAVRKAVDNGVLLVSEATMNELPTFSPGQNSIAISV